MSINELGYDQLGNKRIRMFTENPRSHNRFDKGVAPEIFVDGELGARLSIVDGHLQSKGYKKDVSGWKIDSDGDVEFESGTFRGDITGATGTFSGALSGATGTFSGALSGATGTFSGGLSGATGTFSGAVRTGTLTNYTEQNASHFKMVSNGKTVFLIEV